MQQKIKLPKKTARRYPAYELYLYGEGNYAEESKNLLLTGIPVLFLPGNAGSYKQGKLLDVFQRALRFLHYLMARSFLFEITSTKQLIVLWCRYPC